MITITELNKIKERLLKSMVDNFKKDGCLEPIVILISQNGEAAFIPTPYTSNLQKQMMIDGIKLVCRKTNPAAVVMINEAWMRQMPKGSTRSDANKFEKELKDTGKSISDYDDKKEVAIMMFETSTGHEMIVRDIDKSNNDLINEERTNEVEGIFCNILTPVSKN